MKLPTTPTYIISCYASILANYSPRRNNKTIYYQYVTVYCFRIRFRCTPYSFNLKSFDIARKQSSTAFVNSRNQHRACQLVHGYRFLILFQLLSNIFGSIMVTTGVVLRRNYPDWQNSNPIGQDSNPTKKHRNTYLTIFFYFYYDKTERFQAN